MHTKQQGRDFWEAYCRAHTHTHVSGRHCFAERTGDHTNAHAQQAYELEAEVHA